MKPLRFFVLASLLVLAMLAVALVPSSDKRLLASALLDAGHVPLYALLAILLLRLLRVAPGLVGRGPVLHYVLAFLGVVFFGLLTEFVQIFVQRDAEVLDLGRDLLGGGAALLVNLAFERRAQRLLASFLILLAIGLLGTGLAELGLIARDYLARDRAFPVLCEFDDAWEGRFVRVLDGELACVEPPSGWEVEGLVGRVKLEVAQFPGLLIREPVADWTAYQSLRLQIRTDEPLELVLRVHDAWHNETFTDRFNRKIPFAAGLSEIRIGLDEISEAPRGRSMDMSRIAGLALFAESPQRELVFYVDSIELAVD